MTVQSSRGKPRKTRSVTKKVAQAPAREPAPRKYKLAELLDGMTPEAMHDAFDWGPDRGREVVD